MVDSLRHWYTWQNNYDVRQIDNSGKYERLSLI